MENLLDVQNLGISFGGLRAVNNFSINIKKEQLYGLIGPNGAGKTTIFNLLTGVYKPDSGKIILDVNDLTGKSTIEINKSRNCKNISEYKTVFTAHRTRQCKNRSTQQSSLFNT